MIEVRQEDREAAAARVELEISRGNQVGWHLDTPGMIRHKLADKIELTQAFAAHRQQAEDAMLERCARVALSPGFIEARDTEWDEGVNYAKRYIATAIRGIDAGGEG